MWSTQKKQLSSKFLNEEIFTCLPIIKYIVLQLFKYFVKVLYNFVRKLLIIIHSHILLSAKVYQVRICKEKAYSALDVQRRNHVSNGHAIKN